jgi:hypothetical protein
LSFRIRSRVWVLLPDWSIPSKAMSRAGKGWRTGPDGLTNITVQDPRFGGSFRLARHKTGFPDHSPIRKVVENKPESRKQSILDTQSIRNAMVAIH